MLRTASRSTSLTPSLAGQWPARLARAVLDLDRQLADIDKRISTRFEVHRHHAVITSMVGIGNLLGAEFLAAADGSLDGVRLRRSPGRLRRTRAHTPGLGTTHRQPAPAEALQPPTPARVLHLGADQHPAKPGVQGVLRPQESRRQTTQPGRARPRPPARKRPLGHAPRPTHLPGRPPNIVAAA
jgi:hypothetical protein